ncbi:MAG: lysophospholipid acyltransferase family protein [Flavobacteriaceae bacterium]|nr:lysophospholipid acyltransferase family protein [Flavobacteriaceae bacterium]
MQKVIYLIAFPLLWVISKLPFPLFYLISDGVYFILFYLVGYRKNVVLNNLKLAFPEKEERELKQIRKKFYRHMCDVFLEMIKMMSMPLEEHKKRFVFTNPELMQEIEKKQGVLVMLAHYANWEWPVIIDLFIESKGYAVYRRINNPHFDSLVKRIRSKYGAALVKMSMVSRTVVYNERNNIRGAYAMVGDQSPFKKSIRHWATFMGIKIPFHNGSENLAKRLDMAMVYLKVEKVKRGYYQATFVPLTTTPKEYEDYEITDLYIQEIEKQLRDKPEYYLWTHKRWKHRNLTPD